MLLRSFIRQRIAALFYRLFAVERRSFFVGGIMAEDKLKEEDCLKLLKEKYESLQGSGEARFPKRSDFSERQVVAIKAFLGPWPRALEKAGIKAPREDDKLEKNKEKRIRAKRRRIEALKNIRKEDL